MEYSKTICGRSEEEFSEEGLQGISVCAQLVRMCDLDERFRVERTHPALILIVLFCLFRAKVVFIVTTCFRTTAPHVFSAASLGYSRHAIALLP